jgi:hypothetical protein
MTPVAEVEVVVVEEGQITLIVTLTISPVEVVAMVNTPNS